uniref:Uncharacterized protein n=1 Tax=Parascaris equorum TaxID=6256 RepID=A0A914RMC8_PAREQ
MVAAVWLVLQAANGAVVMLSLPLRKLTEEEWMQLQDFSTAFNPQLPPFDRADMWLPTCEKSAEMANIVLSSSRDRVVDKLTGRFFCHP